MAYGKSNGHVIGFRIRVRVMRNGEVDPHQFRHGGVPWRV